VRLDAEGARAILSRCEAGTISPAVALMQLLIEAEDAEVVARFVDGETASSPAANEIRRLLESKRSGADRVAAMLASGVDRPPVDATVAEGIAFCRRLFDWSVTQSEEASVALYSLGDATLLGSATEEIVDWLEAEGVLGATRDALDIGCGIGRMEIALATRVRSVTGIDVSRGMLERARARCSGLANVRLMESGGEDLRELGAASFDLVLVVDVFPYLVQSAFALAATHVAEAARVLRPGGDLVILGFSYRGSRDQDIADVARLAEAHGFAMAVEGRAAFTLWDGLAFRLLRLE
jgi:SAM-dependent methyltransferase